MTWNLAEAGERLGEILNLALTEGPQTIIRHDETVVVLSAETYAELTGEKLDFREYLLRGTGLDELDLRRDPGVMRDVDL